MADKNTMMQTKIDLSELIHGALQYLGIDPVADNTFTYQFTSLILVFLGSLVIWTCFRLIVMVKLSKLILRSKNAWDDQLYEAGVFRRFANLTPGIFAYYANFWVHDASLLAFKVVYYVASLYIIFASYLFIQAILSGVDRIYQQTRFAERAPITGFIQVGRLLTTIVVIFLVLSLLMGQSPIYLLSGLTAIAAVLLLIFRDTILGFVAGIQIAANRMFNTKDWIEIPKLSIDGEILEIGLTIVKVQNWDKTISTVPTYVLTSEAVKNWRGMSEAKGRRIKRSVLIDIASVQFATEEHLTKWSKFKVLDQYLRDKQSELDNDKQQLSASKADLINSRRLTNIGTFRAYIECYLRNHPGVRHDLTCMVRQLKPSEVGLPIEIYCFAKDIAWVNYEKFQADIFDHILATMPLFGLKAYQRVTNEKGDQ